jgi:non-ribosomal peptide synthetase component E (peptide arylation enzyme)
MQLEWKQSQNSPTWRVKIGDNILAQYEQLSGVYVGDIYLFNTGYMPVVCLFSVQSINADEVRKQIESVITTISKCFN